MHRRTDLFFCCPRTTQHVRQGSRPNLVHVQLIVQKRTGAQMGGRGAALSLRDSSSATVLLGAVDRPSQAGTVGSGLGSGTRSTCTAHGGVLTELQRLCFPRTRRCIAVAPASTSLSKPGQVIDGRPPPTDW